MRACQIQELRQNAPSLQRALLYRMQRLSLFGRQSSIAGQASLQHQTRQRRAQFMRHIGCKTPLPRNFLLQALHQVVNGLHRHAQLLKGLLWHQGLASVDIQG